MNYACHPTTLAWENTLISPDYVGAMREVVEGIPAAPCLFLQGASGDLGPREGYVGDTTVADRNGRQLGFAALSGLEALPPPGTYFEYAGPVVSGAILGTWKHRPLSDAERTQNSLWNSQTFVAPLPYRLELPTVEATRAELAKWEAEEAAARAANDTARVVGVPGSCRADDAATRAPRDRCRRAMRTRCRSAWRGSVVRSGSSPPGELYQHFQTDAT